MAGRYSTNGVRSAYAGGYSEAIKRQMDRVVIPDKVKCEVCKKFRPQSFFSKRQLENLRNAIVVQGPRAAHGAHAKCRDCVGTPNFELRCSICDQTKGLEDFAKNQRQNRDMARCLNCVQNHTDSEPVLEETKHMLEIEGSAASLTTSHRGGGTYPATTRRSSEMDGDVDDDASSMGGGVWVEKENAKNKSEERSSGYQFNAYDPQGNLHRRTTAPSEAGQSEASQSVHRGWNSWGVTASSQPGFSSYNSPSQTPRRSNFAKVPAARPERSSVATVREPEPAPPAVDDEDDDENGLEDYL